MRDGSKGVVDEAARARAEAINGFAAVLRELRTGAGNPSFREMSGRSRAISHTTLHEAAQGNRLASWETTVEFVKACGADPADYRERWERANRAVRSANGLRQPVPVVTANGAGRRAVAAGPDPGPSGPEPPAPAVPVEPPTGPDRARRRTVAALVAGGLVIAVVAVVVVLVTRPDGGRKAGGGAKGLSAADCPVRQTNPPPAPPAHPGDASAFISDLTLPDCTHVRRGETVTKIWRFKNVGSVPWHGYSLHRIDLPQRRDQCQTIADLPVADTPVGGIVDVRAEVTAPPEPGFCFVRFKMVDASGAIAFPGRRPVNFQIIVD